MVLKRAQVGQHVGSCHAVLAQSHEVFLRSFPLPGFLEVGEMVLGPSVRSWGFPSWSLLRNSWSLQCSCISLIIGLGKEYFIN